GQRGRARGRGRAARRGGCRHRTGRPLWEGRPAARPPVLREGPGDDHVRRASSGCRSLPRPHGPRLPERPDRPRRTRRDQADPQPDTRAIAETTRAQSTSVVPRPAARKRHIRIHRTAVVYFDKLEYTLAMAVNYAVTDHRTGRRWTRPAVAPAARPAAGTVPTDWCEVRRCGREQAAAGPPPAYTAFRYLALIPAGGTRCPR